MTGLAIVGLLIVIPIVVDVTESIWPSWGGFGRPIGAEVQHPDGIHAFVGDVVRPLLMLSWLIVLAIGVGRVLGAVCRRWRSRRIRPKRWED